MTVTLQSATGRSATYRTRGCSTDQQACAQAVRALNREKPGQHWRPVRVD